MIPAIKIKMQYTKTLRPNKKKKNQCICADDCQINLFQDRQMMLLEKTEQQHYLVTINDLFTCSFKILYNKRSVVSLW